MNIFKKVFCRIYQAAFHAALPILPYREPERLSSVNDIPALLKKLGRHSALMITDASLRRAGVTSMLESAMNKSSVKLTIYDKTRPNPMGWQIPFCCPYSWKHMGL